MVSRNVIDLNYNIALYDTPFTVQHALVNCSIVGFVVKFLLSSFHCTESELAPSELQRNICDVIYLSIYLSINLSIYEL